jgi:serine protease Do
MRTNWKIPALAAIAMFALATASAQKERKERTGRKNQSITIVRTGDSASAEKMTIVVDGDKVTINGKPVEDYKGSDIRVITSDEHFKYMTPGRVWSAPKVPRAPLAIRRVPGADFAGWNTNGAVLGVNTEDGDGGAKITEVTKDGAAEKAGLKEGDIITKVNDFNVADADDLPMAIKKFKADDKVTITYKRDGKQQTATATLQKNKGFATTYAMADMDFNFDFDHGNQAFALFGKPRLGLQIEDLEEGNGVKVLDVNEETPAEKAGLKKDDVITSFNGKEVKGVDDIRNAMKDVKAGETVKVNYRRGGSTQSTEIKFPKPVKKATL